MIPTPTKEKTKEMLRAKEVTEPFQPPIISRYQDAMVAERTARGIIKRRQIAIDNRTANS